MRNVRSFSSRNEAQMFPLSNAIIARVLPPFLLLSITIALLDARAAEWQPAKAPLMTCWAKDVSPANPLPEYPPPQMVRSEWQNLNGLWDFAVTANDSPKPETFSQKILVPFPAESALSGVMTN